MENVHTSRLLRNQAWARRRTSSRLRDAGDTRSTGAQRLASATGAIQTKPHDNRKPSNSDFSVFDLFRSVLGSAPPLPADNLEFQLQPEEIIHTAVALRARVEGRFPDRGIGRMASHLETLARGTVEQIRWARRPLFGIRLVIVAGILALAGLAARILIGWRLPTGVTNLVDLAEVMDAFMNELLVVGAGLFFVFSFEGRVKRRRALTALRDLRALAHIIDMHQLTKDPARIPASDPLSPDTPISGEEENRELVYYLDLCSEMLAIVSKLAALYAQSLDDPVVLAAVDEVESLTSGLSAKIWQKIVILDRSLSV